MTAALRNYRITPARDEEKVPGKKSHRHRPRIVMALPDLSFAAKCARDFQQLGWEVFLVESGNEARHLARRLSPKVVVLGTCLPDESGWLTCEKLRGERPRQKVFLVAPKQKADSQAFARFVGAAGLVSQEDSVDALIQKVIGTQAVMSNE
jgi:DNA-binding response OmpR family regulator